MIYPAQRPVKTFDSEEEAIEELETEPAPRELTEWEKRLESLENNR